MADKVEGNRNVSNTGTITQGDYSTLTGDIYLIINQTKETLIRPSKLYLNRHFKGREETLSEINKGLKSASSILLHGIGGIGKTSLVKEAVKRKENIYFFDIEGGIKEKFYLEIMNEDIPKEKVLSFIANVLDHKDNIIILDNAEENDRKDIETFLSKLTQAKVLLTSRSDSFRVEKKIDVERVSDQENYALFDRIFRE